MTLIPFTGWVCLRCLTTIAPDEDPRLRHPVCHDGEARGAMVRVRVDVCDDLGRRALIPPPEEQIEVVSAG